MREKEIKIIASDLDGTLLTSDKKISPGTRRALDHAAEAGIELVPATGRFFEAMPDEVRALPFLHYAITINGAQVIDVRRRVTISGIDLRCDTALGVMRYLDSLPVIYDAVMDDWGYMTKSHYDLLSAFTVDELQLALQRKFRRPVDDLKEFVSGRGRGLRKIVVFMKDRALRASLLSELPKLFPGTSVSSSYYNNIEINDEHANKGEALKNLAGYLGVDMSQTMAFGDGLNDAGMLKAAGVGVAMGNACDEAREAADFVTLTCDEGGIAAAIEKFCFGGE